MPIHCVFFVSAPSLSLPLNVCLSVRIPAGTDVQLVTAVQTHGNARVVVSGSLSMCSDEFFFKPFIAGGKK